MANKKQISNNMDGASNTPWQCKACTLIQSTASNQSCELCGTLKSEPKVNKSNEKMHDYRWECPQCTLLQSIRSMKCKLCEYPNNKLNTEEQDNDDVDDALDDNKQSRSALSNQIVQLCNLPEIDREKGIKLLTKLLSNILSDPSNQKYRTLNFNTINSKFHKSRPCLYLLFSTGFKQSSDGQRLLWHCNSDNLSKLQNVSTNIKFKSNSKIKLNTKIKLKDKSLTSLKGIEFNDVNDKNKIFIGALCQISKEEKDPIEKYWNELNIGSLYDDSLQKTVGIIQSIYSYDQTVEMKICNNDQIQIRIVPIKAVKSIIYETKIPKTQQLLVLNYIHTEIYNKLIPRNNRNIPPFVSKLCNLYYSNDLRLIPEQDEINKEELIITREQCKLSSFLSSTILFNDNIQTLYIKNTSYHALESIVAWLKHHNGMKPAPLPCPIRSIHMQQIVTDKWDATFIDPFTKKEIFNIIIGANILGITDLMHLGSAKIATLIKQLDQKEINRIIEEEELYKSHHI